MKKITRRRFLTASLGAVLLAVSGFLLKSIFRPVGITPGEARTLAAYLDTLIPADATPGAMQLGVHFRMISRAEGDRKYRRLIKKGCHWLDRAAGKYNVQNFPALSEAERFNVVNTVSGEPVNTLPGIFFKQTLRDAFFHYYAREESWTGLGYDGPPQPYGFRDYTSPPYHDMG